MATSSVPAGRHSIPLERIATPGNVRDLNAKHVDALAKSIRLRGLREPTPSDHVVNSPNRRTVDEPLQLIAAQTG